MNCVKCHIGNILAIALVIKHGTKLLNNVTFYSLEM